MFANSTIDFQLPVDRNNNLHNPFTSEDERKWLEEELDTNLGVNLRKDNFWKTKKVKCGKDAKILKLDSPKDYIDYLILKANSLYIASEHVSPKEYKASQKFRLVSEDFDSTQRARKVNKKVEGR